MVARIRAETRRRVPRKPRIPARCAPMLAEIDNYIHRYDVRGAALPSAASDVLDGWVTRNELEPLVRRRLVTVERYYNPAGNSEDRCGRHFTAYLTERAIGALWPDRAGDARK